MMLILQEGSFIYGLPRVLELFDNSTIKVLLMDFTEKRVARKKGEGHGKVSDEVHIEGVKYFSYLKSEIYDATHQDVFRVISGKRILGVRIFTSFNHSWQHLTPIFLLGRNNFKKDRFNRVYFDYMGKSIYNPKAISILAGKALRQMGYSGVYESYNSDSFGQLQLLDFERKVLKEDVQASFSIGIPPTNLGGIKMISPGVPHPSEDSIHKAMKVYLSKNKMPRKEDLPSSR